MKILFLILLVLLTSCIPGQSGGGGGGSKKSKAPVYGKQYAALYTYTDSPSAALIETIGFDLENKDEVIALEMFTSDTDSKVWYLRILKGTYKRNGDKYTFSYTYSTCGTVDQEVVTITSNDYNKNIRLTSSLVSMVLDKVADSDEESDATFIEDIYCDEFPE